MKFGYQKFILCGHDPKKALVARPYVPVYLLNWEKRSRKPLLRPP
jgi:hypothetical protein